MKQRISQLARVAMLVAAVLCVLAVVARSQTVGKVEVTHNVNLRVDPSTALDPIEMLRPPERLDLVEPGKVNNYYHVRSEDGDEGWVWGNNVRVLTEEEILALQPPASSSGAAHVLATWPKGTVKKTTFNGKEGPCPFNGNGSDADQFTLKNRADYPTSFKDVSWQAIFELPYPGRDDGNYAKPHRKDWIASELAVIEPFENIAVRVIGYIVAIKPQNGGNGEGTNCNFNKVGDVDTHIALVANVGDGEKGSIVIEWTPRFLKAHPNSTKSKLLPWLDSDNPVRVTGWLMVDPDHVNHLGRYRGTLWELHPITKFEVYRDGQFVDLDNIE
jgi:hypothetical protein